MANTVFKLDDVEVRVARYSAAPAPDSMPILRRTAGGEIRAVRKGDIKWRYTIETNHYSYAEALDLITRLTAKQGRRVRFTRMDIPETLTRQDPIIGRFDDPIRVEAENPNRAGAYHKIDVVGTGWMVSTGIAGSSDGRVLFTQTSGDWVEITFYGVGISLISYASQNRRSIDVYLDDQFVGTIEYAQTQEPTPQYIPYSVVGLPPGEHRLRVVANHAPSGIAIDAFDIYPHFMSVVENPDTARRKPRISIESQDRVYVFDFKDKQQGSTLRNKSVGRHLPLPSFPASPSAVGTEWSNQADYNAVMFEGGGTFSRFTSEAGNRNYVRYEFDVSDIAGGDTSKIRNYLRSLTVYWRGYGTIPGGNGVELYIWNAASSSWELLGSHNAGSPTPIEVTLTSSLGSYIDNGRKVNILATQSAVSNGTSIGIYVDYVRLTLVHNYTKNPKIVRYGRNLVLNPDFEMLNPNGSIVSWNRFGDARPERVLTHSGKVAVKSAPWTSRYSQSSIPCIPGQQYVISAWVMGDPSRVALLWQDHTGSELSQSHLDSPAFDTYTRVERVFTAPDRAVRMGLRLLARLGGPYAYFDDVQLELADGPDSVASSFDNTPPEEMEVQIELGAGHVLTIDFEEERVLLWNGSTEVDVTHLISATSGFWALVPGGKNTFVCSDAAESNHRWLLTTRVDFSTEVYITNLPHERQLVPGKPHVLQFELVEA